MLKLTSIKMKQKDEKDQSTYHVVHIDSEIFDSLFFYCERAKVFLFKKKNSKKYGKPNIPLAVTKILELFFLKKFEIKEEIWVQAAKIKKSKSKPIPIPENLYLKLQKHCGEEYFMGKRTDEIIFNYIKKYG